MSLAVARAITLASIFGSAAAIAGLAAIAPSLGVDMHDPGAWLRAAPREEVYLVGAWCIATVICLYLVLTSLAYIAATLTEARRALRTISWVTLPPVRRAVDTIAAVAVAVTTLGPFNLASAAAYLERTDPLFATPREQTAARVRPPGHGGIGFTPDEGTMQPVGGPEAPPDDERIHLVVPGDNLWRIACRQIRDAVDDPSLDQVTTYWLHLIERNIDGLRSGDADLIYPGETIHLPPMDDTST